MHDQPDWRARSDRDRGLDAQVALGYLVSRSRHAVLRRHPDRLHEVALAGQRELRTHAQDSRHANPLQQLPRVEVDLVRKAGVAGGVGRRDVVDPQRAPSGKMILCQAINARLCPNATTLS